MCLHSIGFSYLRESHAPARPSLGRCHSASAPAPDWSQIRSHRCESSQAITSQFSLSEMGSDQLMLVYEPINGHAAQIKAWEAWARCRNSLRSKSLRKVSIGTPSALLQVALHTSVCSDRQPETAKSGVT